MRMKPWRRIREVSRDVFFNRERYQIGKTAFQCFWVFFCLFNILGCFFLFFVVVFKPKNQQLVDVVCCLMYLIFQKSSLSMCLRTCCFAVFVWGGNALYFKTCTFVIICFCLLGRMYPCLRVSLQGLAPKTHRLAIRTAYQAGAQLRKQSPQEDPASRKLTSKGLVPHT